MPMMGPQFDLTGRVFGDLTVISYVPGTATKHAQWLCRCTCGNTRLNSTNQLNAGRAFSCGCTRSARVGAKKRTHGHTTNAGNSRTYRIWTNMKSRCDNPNFTSYGWYGGRGIGYASEWASFAGFLFDMGECPDGLTLERRDSDKNYSKSNCYWATWTEQARNTRRTRWLTVLGERISLQAAAAKYSINPGTLWARLSRGQSPEVALRLVERK